MTDIRQLLHSTIEIEGLLKVLLDRDDEHAAERLRDRFGEYSARMNEFLSGLADPHLAQVKDEEAEEPQLKTSTAAAVEALDHAEKEVGEDMSRPDEAPEKVEEEAEHLQPGVVVESDSDAVEAAAEEEEPEPEPAPAAPTAPAKKRAPLLNALTLNDKFFFIRNVFDGNDSDFYETLYVIDDMETYEEAEDYITCDMMMDPDKPEVRAFLDFLKKNMK